MSGELESHSFLSSVNLDSRSIPVKLRFVGDSSAISGNGSLYRGFPFVISYLHGFGNSSDITGGICFCFITLEELWDGKRFSTLCEE